MLITDVFKAKKIANVATEVASNKIPYLGVGLFPPKKKMGLDLSWFKNSKGLPVSLKASAFDTVSTLRSREGIKIEETEMAFFKESMLVKEKDEQEIMRVVDSNDPYAKQIIEKLYSDANTLVEGAEVVPERMIWQLLAPQTNGKPSISIASDNATYYYDYDPDNSWVATNYLALTGNDVWSDTNDSDPLDDIKTMCDDIENRTGTRPTRIVMSAQTMSYLEKNDKIKSAILAQNTTANVFMNAERVKGVFSSELDLKVSVYTKKYKNEAGVTASFYPDGYVTLLPDGALGNTWYGVTPEERSLMGDPTAEVALVNDRIAVTVTRTSDPVQTKTTVSEVVLPSYEQMDFVGVIKVY